MASSFLRGCVMVYSGGEKNLGHCEKPLTSHCYNKLMTVFYCPWFHPFISCSKKGLISTHFAKRISIVCGERDVTGKYSIQRGQKANCCCPKYCSSVAGLKCVQFHNWFRLH